MKKIFLTVFSLWFVANSFSQNSAPRTVISLENDWKFANEEVEGAEKPELNTATWETVSVPHDWAIKGPFDKKIDAQKVRVTQDLEEEAKMRTGRTGALPQIGVGWYRKTFELPEFEKGKKVLLTFDGAMSDAHVWVNDEKVGNHPYGYAYFYFDITGYLNEGAENLLAVRLENLPFSSRWYPGAGIYGKVQLIVKDEVNFNHWGTFITNPFVSYEMAQVNIKTEINGENVKLVTEIKNSDGNLCPNADNQLNFDVSGAGKLKVVCNGDATSLEMFHKPTMKAFSGKLVVTVQSLEEAGEIKLKVDGKGLKSETIAVQTTN